MWITASQPAKNKMKDGWEYEQYLDFLNYLFIQMMSDEPYTRYKLKGAHNA